MGPIRCPETSVNNYHTTPCNYPEDHRYHSVKIHCVYYCEQVGPQKLAGEVCLELASKISVPAHELCLEEVVCGGALTRPLHHTERVLDVVLRWGYWSDVDRRDNCLVLCHNTVLKEAAGQV
jgi:hypothetical protein